MAFTAHAPFRVHLCTRGKVSLGKGMRRRRRGSRVLAGRLGKFEAAALVSSRAQQLYLMRSCEAFDAEPSQISTQRSGWPPHTLRSYRLEQTLLFALTPLRQPRFSGTLSTQPCCHSRQRRPSIGGSSSRAGPAASFPTATAPPFPGVHQCPVPHPRVAVPQVRPHHQLFPVFPMTLLLVPLLRHTTSLARPPVPHGDSTTM